MPSLGEQVCWGERGNLKNWHKVLFFSQEVHSCDRVNNLKTTENSHDKLLFQFHQNKTLPQKPIENRTLHLTKLRKKIFQESTGTSFSETETSLSAPI